MNDETIAVISEIESDLLVIEKNDMLYKDMNFIERANAIDFIDIHIIDRIEGLEHTARLNTLMQRAETIKHKLEETDINLFRHLRSGIKDGIYAKAYFIAMVNEHIGYNVNAINQPDKIGYDKLDVFINGLLLNHPLPEPTVDREPDMVFYQQTPARIIFELAASAKFNHEDVFFDLGSGLGLVSILVNLICGITTKGIEYEPAYCNYATACATRLCLPNVQFINTNALNADYSDGTVFFLYTPFEGQLLHDVLQMLKIESQKRAIKVFTYGRCSVAVYEQNWLYCVNGEANDLYRLYEFKSITHSVKS